MKITALMLYMDGLINYNDYMRLRKIEEDERAKETS
jgi:hypothetical protein